MKDAIHAQPDCHFTAAIKENRLIALSGEDRKKKRFVCVGVLDFLRANGLQGWLKAYAKAGLVVRSSI